ncbi:MAG: phospho-sugar mutase [Verrucomicrobiaceae bacterium]|nr:phospho-sugar mutase [Verrucomicrobiaceae bacterium]
MEDLNERLAYAVKSGQLLESSKGNIINFLKANPNPLYIDSVNELSMSSDWEELNDRFFKQLTFGTGGLRGRTIGKRVTRAEQAEGSLNDRPRFTCVGTNAMNNFNVSRATRGLVSYLSEWLAKEGSPDRVKIVFCHDTRHFSRDFAELCAGIAADMGAEAFLFDSHRATPVMSFAIRHMKCHAGVMITASHNPSHDNGYKVNFADGAAIIPPHTDGIIARVNAIASEHFEPLSGDARGSVTAVPSEIDDLYLDRVKDLLLQPQIVSDNNSLKIVFTALHGAGGVHAPMLLRDLGFQCTTTPEQDTADGRFPTVKSPNPENASSLSIAITLAEKTNAEIVMGTDPDCDRLGVAVRNVAGDMTILTGNQIGSLLLYYRLKILTEKGILNPSNIQNAVVIKTFVTTELQSAIAAKFGVNVVNTLTGFKYIGQKLAQYERSLPSEVLENYRTLSVNDARQAQLSHGTFFVFGGEESYGYLACDFTRDKDGNGAVVLFAETAAYAKSLNKSIPELLDDIYQEFGYYIEKNVSRVFEGAEGASEISRLAASYVSHPPVECDGAAVSTITNFATEDISDSEGEKIPKEKMLFIELDDRRRFAVRPSGTEPKIKFYLFGHTAAEEVTAENLPSVKTSASSQLDSLWTWLQEDINHRLNSN